MAEQLHLQPDQGPETELVQLAGETLELDKNAARIIRDQFETMAAQYGASLEDFKQRFMQTVGTQQPMPQMPMPPQGLDVPDPDLLFQNKGAWTEEFGRSLQGQLGNVRQENLQAVQGLANAFQQELNRRDTIAQAKQLHDKAMEEMLDRRGLSEHTVVVQAIYNQQYDKLKHLPLELGLDRIGQLAQDEIQRIRSGEQWQIAPGQSQTGVTQRPPAMLRSARRASRPSPAPAAASSEQGLEPAGGGLGMMGSIIRKRQASVLGGSAA